MTRSEMIALARMIAAQHGLDPALVCAICHHESNDWQTWAARYEPGFFRRYIQPMETVQTWGIVSNATERALRATSFGLMQIMGQVARERGFNGDYLTELCDPPVGIEFGCRELGRRLKNAGGIVRDGLLAYNGGGNLAYPEKVLAHYPEYKDGR